MSKEEKNTENTEKNSQLIKEILSIPLQAHQNAEDIRQDACLKCLNQKQLFFAYDGQCKRCAWLIVQNLRYDFFRSQKHHPASIDNAISDRTLGPEYQIMRAEEREFLLIAIYTELNEREQIVILGHYYAELTFHEIANSLEVSVSTVYRFHESALKKLGNALVGEM